LLRKSDRAGRIYFIVGQVYQKLGFESEAFNFYRKCLGTNPEYETDFYARLYMAQVAEISRSRDLTAARKSFRRLLKDRKNKEFKDKIYYEIGAFELKQKNINQAISNFNLALREGSNRRIDGEAYLRLGEIYYDTLKNYELSQAYYDSAIGALPTNVENYATIKARQEVLNEFVKNLNTIKWQDSLLVMANMDSAQIRNRIDSVFKEKKRLEELAQGKKKKRRSNRVEIAPTSTNIFGTGEATTETTSWYFGNPSAMSLGESEFRRIWGDIPLEDNWRRSQKISNASVAGNENVVSGNSPANSDQAEEAKPIDPVDAEFDRIIKQIPRTQDQKEASLKKIEDAYFRLGDIYYFDLKEKDNASDAYKKLIERFPKSDYVPEAYYKLYLIAKESNEQLAGEYADILKKDYSSSTFAKILINPDYLKESGETIEKQKLIYKTAYDYYQKGNYVDALQTVNEGSRLGQTNFTDNIELLRIMIVGKTENIEVYQNELTSFVQKNPDSELIPYASKLLDTSQEFEKYEQQKLNMRYSRETNGSHYFVIVYKSGESINDVASGVMESFNRNNFEDLNLKTSNLTFNDTYNLTIVSEFANSDSAQRYYRAFNEKLPDINELRNHNFNKFVISTDNFNIFYRTKGLNEYLQFFEKNYPTQTP
ncbi:MAG TPA: tetratricopeptide repeat protein, partial [Cyclobacteriaceae bacterium]|nr:tetratricopeptide repeat protein [Cyclobacteriaceae bacterium]